ncbi:MAG: hypothetical protein HQK97_02125 [Nitrospirae bacterium]|nr:hypothetical protein [Nitrospirota bacterium]
MEFGVIFAESLSAVKKNIIIIAPTIIATLINLIIASVVIGSDLAALNEKNFEQVIVALAPRMLTISALNYFSQVITHCVTTAMALDIQNKGTCNVFDGLAAVVRKGGVILPASVIILVLMTFAIMLFFLPALLVCFAFMLTFIIIMGEDISPVVAMRKSYHTMKDNYSSSIVLFFFLSSVGITVSLLNLIFGQMLYVGVVLSLFLSGVFMSFATITLLKYYQIIQARQTPCELP